MKESKKEIVFTQLKLMDSVPLTAKEIEGLTGVDPRQMRHIARELRMEHVKLCSGDKGYWLWNGKDDSWNRTKARIRSQAKKELELLKAMEDVLDGQQTFNLKEKEETWRDALKNL